MNKIKHLLLIIILINLVVFNINTRIYAQQPIEVKPSIYMDSLKRLYVKDSMPIYFFMSYSADKTQSVQLQSNNPKANPMYFDGDGNHFLKHQDNYLEESIEFHVFNDGKPPVTFISLDKKSLIIKNKICSSANVEITLNAKDELSGVDKVYYSLDGAPYAEYKDGFKLQNEKEYILKYYAVDHVGNMEDVITKDIIIDVSAPKSTYSVDKDYYGNVLSVRSAISLSANDATGTGKLYYILDDGPEKIYTLPIKTFLLTEGEHTLKYYTIDLLENKETPNTFNFFIDKTPPIVVEELEGSNYVVGGKEYASGRSKVKLTAIDNKAGVKSIFYSVNYGTYMLYSDPFYLSSDKAGLMNIKTYALDNVNNKADFTQGSNKMTIPYVDLTGPTLNYEITGTSFKNQDSLVISKNSKIILKANDTEAGLNRITYVLNNNNEIEYNTPITVEKEGPYNLSYTAYDNVDNSSNKFFSFSLDNTGPDIYTRFSIASKGKKIINGKNLDVYPSHVILFLSATDLFVGIQKITYSINSDIEKPYDKMISGFAKGKEYQVKIKAFDMLGNFTESELDFYIE
jgi:hypothetical protein